MGLPKLNWRHSLVVGGVLLGAGTAVGIWFGADYLVGRLYRHLRPDLERQIGKGLGHPLQLGPYQGLRPWGLAIGPSRVEAGPADNSTAAAQGLGVAIAPWASLVQGLPVVQLAVQGGSLELEPNRQGQFWVFSGVKGQAPPRLALRVRLVDPASVAVKPLNLKLRVDGGLSVALHRSAITWSGAALLPPEGRFALQGDANWDTGNVRLNLGVKRQPLAGLVSLLPNTRGTSASGWLDGRLRLSRSDGRNSCNGALNLNGLGLEDELLPGPLKIERLALRCSGERLNLSRTPWQMANWQGVLNGRLELERWFDFRLTAEDPKRGDQLAFDLRGPWRQPRLEIAGQIPLGRGTPTSPEPLRFRGQVLADWRQSLTLRLAELQLNSGRSELLLAGPLWPRLNLDSRALGVHPSLWESAPWLESLLGEEQWLSGRLSLSGTWSEPVLRSSLAQAGRPLLEIEARRTVPPGSGPLGTISASLRAPNGLSVNQTTVLGPARASLAWRGNLLRLTELQSPELSASGSLPLRWQKRRGLVAGNLDLAFAAPPFALQRLSPLLGVELEGDLAASGSLRGPLADLRPDVQLTLRNPGGGPLSLKETWRGSLTANVGAGSSLRMRAQGPAPPGELRARLSANWLPQQVVLERREGQLRLVGSPQRYQWVAEQFPFDGLAVEVGPRARPTPIGGRLSGQGSLDFQPLAASGSLTVERPMVLELLGKELTASGGIRERLFQLKGRFEPLEGGLVTYTTSGQTNGALRAQLEGRRLPLEMFSQLVGSWPLTQGASPLPRGRAEDLGTVLIETFGESIDTQLRALQLAKERLAAFQVTPEESAPMRLQDLRGLVDADLTLAGPTIGQLRLDLAAKGHLWQRGADKDKALGLEPLVVTIQGALSGGQGSFGFDGLSLSLLALFTPVPASLRGVLSLKGQYQLGDEEPSFSTTIALREGFLNDTPLNLEQGELSLAGNNLNVQGALRGGGAENSVDLIAEVPLDPEAEGLRLRLSSRGDGLRFLNGLIAGETIWQKGSADLEVLVRGSLSQPVANGFLRFREGELALGGQEVRELEATILFDFEELLVQEFSARVGEKGTIKAGGGLGLTEVTAQRNPLVVEISQARIRVPRLEADIDGELGIGGSLLKPLLGGELQVSKGSINAQPGGLGRSDANGMVEPVAVQQLVEEKWDFQQPLVLFGPEVETTTGLALRQAIPNFSYVRLNDLRLSFGPDLLVVAPPVATFKTGGLLTLNGPIDRTLSARGVVRLLSGRLSFFTTNFTLDPDAPNVAVFTPSQGLVPFLDIALRTRISNTLNTGSDRSALTDLSLRGDFTTLDQLNLVRVVLKVSGPADRIGESFELRSNPPISEQRLVALIGGNTVAGLSGGNAGAALATVVGQTLLSPLLSSLTDALGQRISFAIYPTFVTPSVNEDSEETDQSVPSQLVLGTELGLDLSDRFNFSVLAAPNRSDIPPELTLRYQATDNIGLQGTFDTEGRWQTRLQLFFRF